MIHSLEKNESDAAKMMARLGFATEPARGNDLLTLSHMRAEKICKVGSGLQHTGSDLSQDFETATKNFNTASATIREDKAV